MRGGEHKDVHPTQIKGVWCQHSQPQLALDRTIAPTKKWEMVGGQYVSKGSVKITKDCPDVLVDKLRVSPYTSNK